MAACLNGTAVHMKMMRRVIQSCMCIDVAEKKAYVAADLGITQVTRDQAEQDDAFDIIPDITVPLTYWKELRTTFLHPALGREVGRQTSAFSGDLANLLEWYLNRKELNNVYRERKMDEEEKEEGDYRDQQRSPDLVRPAQLRGSFAPRKGERKGEKRRKKRRCCCCCC